MKIKTKNAPLVDTQQERAKRERLSAVRVLIADQNARTAALVRRILYSFGFRAMEVVTSGAEALDKLRREPFDLIVTERHMDPVDGISLARTIRTAGAEANIRRDIPIMMITADAGIESVEDARDAGVNEFIAKPFSARTVSDRIIQIIDKPRLFIETPNYVGPCRRRNENRAMTSKLDRRVPPELRQQMSTSAAPQTITPANEALREQLQPFTGSELLDDATIEAAQDNLLEAEGEFVEWARDYIAALNRSYATLSAAPQDAAAIRALHEAAYAITSQAGIFGYDLGTQVGEMLMSYLNNHAQVNANILVVIKKHIDTVNVIFTQNVKDRDQQTGIELISSLKQLMVKLN